jgi:hypothetical protein
MAISTMAFVFSNRSLRTRTPQTRSRAHSEVIQQLTSVLEKQPRLSTMLIPQLLRRCYPSYTLHQTATDDALLEYAKTDHFQPHFESKLENTIEIVEKLRIGKHIRKTSLTTVSTVEDIDAAGAVSIS